jgi:sporulation protein YlmC with PRC-barrel domain
MQGRISMRFSATLLFAALALPGTAHAQSTPPAASAPKFIAISNNAILSSRLIGLNVQSAGGETMGRIEDVVFEGGQISGVVLAVGEVLGAGERYVAVDPSGISIRYMEAEDKWQATINASLDQMKAAPEFRYEGKWKR